MCMWSLLVFGPQYGGWWRRKLQALRTQAGLARRHGSHDQYRALVAIHEPKRIVISAKGISDYICLSSTMGGSNSTLKAG